MPSIVKANHSYKHGDLFLGTIDGEEVGVSTAVHALTIAGAGAGKGACVIIPNLKRWPHNVLVIDPKGENARETVADREAMGQNVYVIDPFERSNVDKRFIASFNPLHALDGESLTIADDITSIADGIVMRSGDGGAVVWDNGAQELIAGVIAFVFLEGDHKNLSEVRDVISDTELLNAFAEESKNDKRLGGLLRSGASRVLAKEGQYYVSNAQANTAWLDREPIQNSLKESSFNLSELKNGKASVFLVLPPDYLVSYGRLLRMFVRCAITEMARQTPEGKDKGEQCLFLLDEFYSLGKIQEIAVSCGLMRGFGLQLWPILQDMGQLLELYGREGANLFFSSADLQQYFGNKDQITLNHMSEIGGDIATNELDEPPEKTIFESELISFKSDQQQQMEWQIEEENRMRKHQHKMTYLNRRRYPHDVLANLVKKESDVVADSMFCRLYGDTILFVKPMPYFRKAPPKNADINEKKEQEKQPIITLDEAISFGCIIFLMWVLFRVIS